MQSSKFAHTHVRMTSVTRTVRSPSFRSVAVSTGRSISVRSPKSKEKGERMTGAGIASQSTGLLLSFIRRQLTGTKTPFVLTDKFTNGSPTMGA